MKKFKLQEIDLSDIKENPEPDLSTEPQNLEETEEKINDEKKIQKININEIENENNLNLEKNMKEKKKYKKTK